jgi:hypothetical protein
MEKAEKPNESPILATDFISNLKPYSGDSLIIARCIYSPDPKMSERFIISRIENTRLEKVLDCWISNEEITKAFNELPNHNKWIGGCDAMYSTKERYTWVQRDQDIIIWEKLKLFIQIKNGQIEIKRKSLPSHKSLISSFSA